MDYLFWNSFFWYQILLVVQIAFELIHRPTIVNLNHHNHKNILKQGTFIFIGIFMSGVYLLMYIHIDLFP